ncbi:DNA-3-methyladenine glycosylase I [Schumannella soli]|uniref:DNA-3-methyladenine glycosylase I n=1 Tax=Schumannella soli TaxID=2590779 RepID=A0A506XTE3_9MICO|nr:DNA-3-methyladenine glycosylase I [Schumannella soli]TPW75981.1 DNA-3-methyladenine glycosylase I [Schumannella soli]
MSERPALHIGTDGVARCGWSGDDPEYQRYHDEEWGRPLHGDRALFEKLSLEAFQSGLSWITILRRRPTFRSAFADFDIETVAAFDDHDVQRLLADPGIIRNRAKIDATIANARTLVDLVRDDPGALDRIVWGFAPPPRDPADRPRAFGDLPAITSESTAASKHLRKLGFRFVGPTTFYALMQSAGLVDDHLAGCWRAEAA